VHAAKIAATRWRIRDRTRGASDLFQIVTHAANDLDDERVVLSISTWQFGPVVTEVTSTRRKPLASS
jgi:hypothetical protein